MDLGTIVGREPQHRHRVFDNSLPPILTLQPGDTVTFECPMCAVPEGAEADDIRHLDPRFPHSIVGPVRIVGAAPGDTLAVEIIAVEATQAFGHCMIVPEFGLLADEFPEPYLQRFQLMEGRIARMKPGIEIPMRPFCGIMAVAPAEPGEHSTTPPRRNGGNMDIARLTAGSTLSLPVLVDGALFSCGDGHAAQGAGEVCGTAIETGVRATVRFDLRPGVEIEAPQFLVAPTTSTSDRGTFVTTAAGPDLYQAGRRAVRQMIDVLCRTRGLTRQEAYVLCSVAVALGIEEIVDQPHWLVSASLPLGIFTGVVTEQPPLGAGGTPPST